MALPYPTKTRTWDLGTSANGTFFDTEFNQLYANDVYLEANPNVASAIVAAAAKATPIGADSIGIVDSADSNALKETTFTNLLAFFDAYYLARFTSAAQTITSGGSLTIAHGLGAIPFFVSAYIKCTSAEVGYSVGDIVYVHSSASTVSYTGFSNNGVLLSANGTTNIDIRFGSAAAVFIVPHKTTGNSTAVTNASWQLYVIAQK